MAEKGMHHQRMHCVTWKKMGDVCGMIQGLGLRARTKWTMPQPVSTLEAISFVATVRARPSMSDVLLRDEHQAYGEHDNSKHAQDGEMGSVKHKVDKQD